MSSAVRPHGVPQEWDVLEQAVRRLLADHLAARRRAALAERKVRELEAALAQLRGGGPDPVALRRRIEQLEEENRALQQRLDDGAERVRRLLARTHFLAEDR